MTVNGSDIAGVLGRLRKVEHAPAPAVNQPLEEDQKSAIAQIAERMRLKRLQNEQH